MPALRSGRDKQFIANTCDCFDLYRTLVELPAKMRYMDIHGAGLSVKVEAPGFL
jgi:hypothetical protein